MDVQPEVVESKEVVELTIEDLSKVGGGVHVVNDGGFGLVPDPHVVNNGVAPDVHILND